MIIGELFLEAVSTDTPAFRNWFAGSKVVDAAGNPLPVYHGTARPDRVGTRFRKARATAGPMAYFTSDPEIGSNYASAKPDTSIGDDRVDYATWFMVKVPGSRSGVAVDKAWFYLSGEEKQRIAALAPRVTTDDDGEDIVLGEPENTRGNGGYDLRAARGNPLKALADAWLLGGSLFDREEEFLKVLKLAGMTTPVKFDHPNAAYPFVYQVFLAIKNPLASTAIPPQVLEALAKGAARQANKPETEYSYQWDKKTANARIWFRDLLDDIEKTGGTTSWTVIPDWVTKTLQKFGYDGIRDVGGKRGGQGHDVWIPFNGHQVKSAISNRNFDPAKKNIHEAVGLDEGPPTVAELPEQPKPIARCTAVSCNAILTHFRKPPIKSFGEVPRTGMDSLKLLMRRGLKYIPDVFLKPQTVRQFVQTHQKGCFYIGVQNHAMAVIDGSLFDAARKGLDARIVQVAAEIVMP